MGILSFLQLRHARLAWLSSMLVLLLQRTPVLRLLVQVDPGLSLRSGSVLRALVPVAVTIGTIDTMTGATKFTANPASPAPATVGQSFAMAFAVTGAPSTPKSYSIDGPLPAGLSVPGATVNGTQRTLNASTGTIIGTPSGSGNFTVSIRAYEGTNRSGEKGPIYSYIINVTGGTTTSPPAFTTQPASQTVTAGGSVSFAVTATGEPAPTYQWRKDGANLAGQTGATLALTNVSATHAGSYSCVATNSAGSATSNAATLTVNAATVAPAFTTQPQSQGVAAGGSVTFSVAVSGTPTPALQWRKNGSAISGRTGTTLQISGVAPGDAGTYDCIATNTAGSATSAGAVLTVIAAAPPEITVQPKPMTTTPGGGAFFMTQATGNGLSYQWYKNGSAIAGATQPAYFLAGVQPSDAGSYSVIVSDGSGNSSTSDAAALSVVAGGTARLVNMSARAGVGTGANVLIPGFVIDGDVALTLLIRGVGPGLAGFDVPGVLSDPVMTLFQGSTAVASNDDWEDAPNLAAVNAAVTSTGAFPLSAGSKDAVLLVALNPGIYTVQVAGKNGVTGEALVELYVVEP